MNDVPVAAVSCDTRRFRSIAALRRVRSLALAVGLPAVLLWAVASGDESTRFPVKWSEAPGPVYARDGGNISPAEITGDPWVVFEDGRYRMWFTTGVSETDWGLACADSLDGVEWELRMKQGQKGPAGIDYALRPSPDAWDCVGVENACVLRSPEGKHLLYYTGDMPKSTWAIGLATSDDGLVWTKHGKPVLEPEHVWEKAVGGNPGGVLEPCVLYDAKEKIYRMWYAGVGTLAEDMLTFRIGYATSQDGISWKRLATQVCDRGAAGSWDEVCASHPHVIVDPNGAYHLFYYASKLSEWRDGIDMQRGHIGHAWSADGITWERNPANPILSPRAGRWDAWTVGGPSALVKDGEIWLWYMGFASSENLYSHIGLVKSPLPTLKK